MKFEEAILIFYLIALLVAYSYLVFLKISGRRPPDRVYYEARKLYKKRKNERLRRALGLDKKE